MKKLVAYVTGIIALAMLPFFVHGQVLDPVSFEVSDVPEAAAAGEAFHVTLQATIEGDWHLYSIANDPDAGPYPTQFSSSSEVMAIAGEVSESEPSIEFDPNFNVELGWHSSSATFTVPVAFHPDTEGITGSVSIDVLYQVCNDNSCLPPKTKTITHPVSVTDAGPDPWPGFAEGWEPPEVTGEDAKGSVSGSSGPSAEEANDVTAGGTTGSGGMGAFLWIAFMAGFAALLTPCVFPMIPLTVSFFSKQGEGRGRRAIGQAVGFGLAIVVTFTVLGALLALIVGASGANQFAANPWVNLFIGATLVVFALSLFGAFELRLPWQVTNWLNRQSNESSGMAGVLFMALTISAVSFSCTAPFVGGVLAATAGGEWFYPIVGMAGFSAAFASPFVVLALFPRWLESLPSSGSWMNLVKVLLGFIELAAAIKFISNADLVWQWGIVSRPFAIAAWIAIFLLAALYVLGIFTLRYEEQDRRPGAGRLMLSLPLLLFSFYLIPGLLGANLGIWDAWLPPKQASDVSLVRTIAAVSGAGAVEEEGWTENYDLAVERALEANTPVFIDFTGYTCTNCRDMEANVFPLPEIQQRFDQMELVRLYTDDGTEGPANQRFQLELTGTVALPTYVFVDPASGEVLHQLDGSASAERFRRFLDEGLSRWRGTASAGAVN